MDKKEVEFHSNLSEVWWDVTGRMKALHSMNPLRVQLIRDGLANAGLKEANPSTPLDGIKILDVGCGGGILSEPLARIGATVTGLDASTQLISTAKEHASLDKNISGRLSYVASTIEDHTSSNQATYDVVVASEIIEHITDQEFFLKSCTNVVKPGGSIFITTPGKTASSWLVAILMAEYVLRIIPQGTHDWNKFISPEETQRLLEKCKFLFQFYFLNCYNSFPFFRWM